MNGKLKIDLEPRADAHGNIYYIGRLKSVPITLDCDKGVSFMIFVSSPGEEQLQISSIDSGVQKTLKKTKEPIIYRIEKDKYDE